MQNIDPDLVNVFNNRQNADSLVWTLEPMPVLVELEHNLKGEYYDEDAGKWICKATPLLNDKGVGRIMGILRSVVNKNIVLGNLKLEDVHEICYDIRIDVAVQLFLNTSEFLLNKNDASTILNLVDHHVFIFLTRPMDAGERNRISTVQRYVETHTDKDNQTNNKGFFNGIFSRNNKNMEG